MSLTSYRAAPPRVGVCGCVCGLGGPGGGRLSRGLGRSIMGAGGFHGRVRDGIGWDTFRQGHQVGQALPDLAVPKGAPGGGQVGGVGVCVVCGCGVAGREAVLAWWWWVSCLARVGAGREADAAMGRIRLRRAARAIRTGRLSALPRVHPRPIDVMVYHGPRGDLVLRGVSRLDAFSGYPVRTWLPGRAAGATTGAPEVRPPRSSRTGGSASQVSNTHGR
jgi:hypothetical protein